MSNKLKRKNKKEIEALDTTFIIADDETGESVSYKFTEKGKDFLRQFPYEGRNLVLFAYMLLADYSSKDFEKPNVADLMCDVLIAYGKEVITQVINDAELEGVKFFVDDKDDIIKNAVKNHEMYVPSILLVSDDPDGIFKNPDKKYSYILRLTPDYDKPHEQSTDNFQFPGNVIPILTRIDKHPECNRDSTIDDIRMFDFFDGRGWIAVEDFLGFDEETKAKLKTKREERKKSEK